MLTIEYIAENKEEFGRLESAMNVFLDNYTLQGNGTIAVRKSVEQILLEPTEFSAIKSIQAKGTNEGEFVAYGEEYIYFKLCKNLYQIRHKKAK